MQDVTQEEFDRTLARAEHLLRLGTDAIELLERCYEECEMDPDLSIDVGTLLIRAQQIAQRRSTP